MEFKEYKLADITEKIYSGGTPSTKEASYWNGELKWLSSGETSNRFIISTEKTITQKGVENSSTKLAFKNDLVMASAGQGYTRGQTSFLKIDTYINQSLIAISVNKDKVHPLYLFYNLISRYAELRQISDSSSTRGSINTKMIKNLNIMIPEKSHQNRIVYLINSIDEKIEINKKIIANLEELSQTLFKRWFVDFEFPDENSNPYKSSGGEMINSKLGEIPSDWKVGVLSDMTEIIMGQSPKSDTYNNNKVGLPLLNGASDFKNRNIKPTKYTSDPKKIGHNLDYVFGVRATIGLVTELDGEYAIGRGAGLSKNNEENREFIYEILNQAFTYFERIGSGSVYINISSKDLKQYKLIIPSKQVLMKYHYQLEPIFSELHNRKKQITSLTNLRDTLLPKLMSGEIELPDDIEVNTDELSF